MPPKCLGWLHIMDMNEAWMASYDKDHGLYHIIVFLLILVKKKNINLAEIGREGWIVTLGTDLSSGSFGDTHSSKTTPIYAVPLETMVISLS